MEQARSGRIARWYFDFISPFACLQWQAVKRLEGVAVDCRPILFVGVLRHHGHKGPAEIAPKRLFTYRHAQWRADRAGIPLSFPPAHPFNPLPALRLCVADGVFGVPSLVVDGEVFWGEDATAMFEAYMNDPALFETPAMRRPAALPVGVVR